MPYRLDPPPDGTTTLDCSLYTLLTYRDAGFEFPQGVRTAEQQRRQCVPIEFSDVLPGDLLFFEHTYEPNEDSWDDGHVASHIGISLGAGTKRMYDSHERDSGLDTGETDISSDYWQSKLFEARRHPALSDVGHAPSPVIIELARGIDVSSHQGMPNWPDVKASGMVFGITKATGGTWYKNPVLAYNWAEMKRAGMIRGAYHWAFELSGDTWPGSGSEAEADYFINEMNRVGGFESGDIVVLDIEEGQGPLGEWALRWAQRIEAKLGFKPWIYTGSWFTAPHLFANTPALSNYPLWLAAYQDTMPSPPAPWGRVDCWQHSSTGVVDGVDGKVDLNVFNGPVEALAGYGKGGAAVVVPNESYYNPGDVGSGLLDMMAADGTIPAMPSVFLPLGRNPATVEECRGMNGVLYTWHMKTGKSWRTRSEAS